MSPFFFIGTYSAFHFATLNEYYVGTLYLPIFNGVSDGSVPIILGLIILGIVGPDITTIGVVDGSWLHLDGIEKLTVG